MQNGSGVSRAATTVGVGAGGHLAHLREVEDDLDDDNDD